MPELINCGADVKQESTQRTGVITQGAERNTWLLFHICSGFWPRSAVQFWSGHSRAAADITVAREPPEMLDTSFILTRHEEIEAKRD